MRMLQRVVLLSAFAGLAVLSTFSARADWVELNDGSVLYGEVLEELTDGIRFRCNVGGIWSTVRYRRSQFIRYGLEEGDQSDQASTGRSIESEAKARNAEETEPATRPHIAVIPLRGQVGGMLDGRVVGTFDAEVLRQCLEEAVENKAEVIVLDIESPGGLVSEMEAICETILEWNEQVRIVAFPRRDAFSAAAIIALCCPEMVVHPESRIGAAVIVEHNRGGVNAVEAKMASPHHARQRQYMAKSGRPYEIVAAMTIQETELWWSPATGFTTTEPSQNPRDEYEYVDNKSTILTMTADDAIRWGLAAQTARNVEALRRSLRLDDDLDIIDMHNAMTTYAKQLDVRLDKLREDFSRYFEGLNGIVNSMNAYLDASKQRNYDLADEYRAAIRRYQSMALAAARSIRRSDRSVLARRVEVPGVIIDRLEQDQELLGRVQRLVNRKTVEDYNEAVERVNEVLAAWQDIL